MLCSTKRLPWWCKAFLCLSLAMFASPPSPARHQSTQPHLQAQAQADSNSNPTRHEMATKNRHNFSRAPTMVFFSVTHATLALRWWWV